MKTKVVCSDELRDESDNGVRNLKSYIEKEYRLIEKDNVPEYWLKTAVDKYYNPKKYYVPEKVEVKSTFQQLPDEFLLKHKLSEVRKKNFRVICRAMMRYELMNVPTEHLFTLHFKNEISCLRKICQTIRN